MEIETDSKHMMSLDRAYYEVLVSRSDLKTSFNAIKSPASMHAENCSAMTRCKLE
jgi:hypothetical protein